MENPQGKNLPVPRNVMKSALVEEAEYKLVTEPQTIEDVVIQRLLAPEPLVLTETQKEILFRPVPEEIVEIRPDGPIYLPAVEFRELLVQAFGLDWELIPEGPPKMEGSQILWGFYLFINGRPKAFAYGGQDYQKGSYQMSYDDALEGAKSNALMRCCKQLHIAADLWRPRYYRAWRNNHATTCQTKDKRTGKMKTLWKRIDDSFGHDVGLPAAGKGRDEAEATGPSTGPAPADDYPIDLSKEPTPEQVNDPDYWRRRAMATAGKLGMNHQDVRNLCSKHFHQYDLEADAFILDGSGDKILVTELKQLAGSQWKKLAEHLHQRWKDAGTPNGKKTEAPADSDKKSTPENSQTPDKLLEQKLEQNSSQSATRHQPFPENASISDMLEAAEPLLDTDALSLRTYLETMFIAQLDNLPEDKAEGIKDWLYNVATDELIRGQVVKDLKIWLTWVEAIDDIEEIHNLIEALAAEKTETVESFLKLMGAKSLRLVTPAKFPTWREVLDNARADAKSNEGFDQTNNPSSDEFADDDIPF